MRDAIAFKYNILQCMCWSVEVKKTCTSHTGSNIEILYIIMWSRACVCVCLCVCMGIYVCARPQIFSYLSVFHTHTWVVCICWNCSFNKQIAWMREQNICSLLPLHTEIISGCRIDWLIVVSVRCTLSVVENAVKHKYPHVPICHRYLCLLPTKHWFLFFLLSLSPFEIRISRNIFNRIAIKCVSNELLRLRLRVIIKSSHILFLYRSVSA